MMFAAPNSACIAPKVSQLRSYVSSVPTGCHNVEALEEYREFGNATSGGGLLTTVLDVQLAKGPTLDFDCDAMHFAPRTSNVPHYSISSNPTTSCTCVRRHCLP